METKLKIIHSNDTHSYVDNFAKRSALINELKVIDTPNVYPLLIDAGDIVSGSIYYTLFNGDAEIKLMNQLNYDYVAIGNHDFDQGINAIEKYIKDGTFDLYCANIKFKDQYSYFNQHIKPYDVKELSDDKKIIVCSLLTLDTLQTSLCNDVMEIIDPFDMLDKLLLEFKNIEHDYIILLSHLGYEVDQEIALKYAAFNLIIGGHSHTELNEPTVINKTIIVQTGMYGKNLGELVVDFDNNIDYYKLHVVDDYPQIDEKVQTIISEYQKQIEQQAVITVGYNHTNLAYSREAIYLQDQPIGNLITDAYFYHGKKDYPYINGAIINGHGIRCGLKAGEVKIKDLMNILPFNKVLCIVEIKGIDLFASLKHGISPQVSHLKLTYINETLKSVYIFEKDKYVPLEDNKTYYIITNDFLANGKDQYIGFSYDKVIVNNLGTDYQVLGDYIKSLPNEFKYEQENRITNGRENEYK